jgi:hypothetical protein
VDGILSAPGAPSDEILMDLPRARVLAGLGSGSIILLRARVEDEGRMVEYLASIGANVLVGREGSNLRVEEGTVVDDRLGALILSRPELARELGRSYVSSFARYSGNSLRVLVIGMAVLTAALFLIIVASSLVRHLVERRRDVGLIMALGGGWAALFSTYGRRVLSIGLLAGLLGLLSGMALGELLETVGAFSFFGHGLDYGVDLREALTIFALYAVVLSLLITLSLLFLLRQQPRSLLYEAPQWPRLVGED